MRELCARARVRHGPLVSARMLYSARCLRPRDESIRVDLVHDVWRLLVNAEHLDVESACEAIADAAAGIDRDGLDPSVAESVDYAHCAALALLGRREALASLFWASAGRRARTPAARARLARLLDHSLAESEARLAGLGAGELAAGLA
jgi:hypothetical protein